ncbi:unnamed protein product, partial [Scytosiphon promiscuus]
KAINDELSKVFGHKQFRSGQEEIVQEAMRGSDVLAVMPTGAGKSLCYQLPAYCCPGLAVVFCPLVSLAQDQVRQVTAVGVQAACPNAGQSQEEANAIQHKLDNVDEHGGIKPLFITPEKYAKSRTLRDTLKRIYHKGLLSRYVIDEAHCMIECGQDYRPDYLILGTLREDFPNVPIMALTATATKEVRGDVSEFLHMRKCVTFNRMYHRDNLLYEIAPKKPTAVVKIIHVIEEDPSASGIIYCLSKKDCENLAGDLQARANGASEASWARGFSVDFYHADRSPRDKERVQRAWTEGAINVVCATIAFGMGINKPDVRYVIHQCIPKFLTNYSQESGRAGRDGKPAKCTLLFSYSDVHR